MKRIVLSLLIIAALSTTVLQAKEKLNILSTIKPIHSLVMAITGDLAESAQVIPNNASPHHYSLKPSDLRRINAADLIFRIDPDFESFLQKSLRSIATEKVVALAQSENMTLLKAKDRHQHEPADSDQHNDAHEEDHDDQATEALDYHLWLNPSNAVAMANTIRDALITAAPQHSQEFTDNAKQLIASITTKDQEIRQQLDAVKETPFLVMHDAWQYFTNHYQLNQLGSISAQERLKPSAKAISEARNTIIRSDVHCLITEPNLKKKTLAVLTEDLSIAVYDIDPLGREIPESNLAYTQLLQYTADKLLNCLKKK